MKIQELAWADEANNRYRIDVTETGAYRIEAADAHIMLPNQQALQALANALAEFSDTPPKAVQHAEPAPTTRPAPTRNLDPDFPKKVRNAIFIMVGVGVAILAFDVMTRFG
jgi:hypothetical protein